MKRRFNLLALLWIGLWAVLAAGEFGCAGRQVAPIAPEPKRMTVAVLEFENHSIGSAEWVQGIGRTLADRVAERLAGRSDLRLIDRESLQRVLEELSLSSRDLVQSEEQLKLGKLLGAHYLITGGITAIGETVRIDGRIIEVEKGVADGTSIQGPLKERNMLEETFSRQVADQIIAKADLPRSRPKTGQDYFIQGIRLEKNNATEALKMYQKALSIDPQHPEARERMENLLLKEIQ